MYSFGPSRQSGRVAVETAWLRHHLRAVKSHANHDTSLSLVFELVFTLPGQVVEDPPGSPCKRKREGNDSRNRPEILATGTYMYMICQFVPSESRFGAWQRAHTPGPRAACRDPMEARNQGSSRAPLRNTGPRPRGPRSPHCRSFPLNCSCGQTPSQSGDRSSVEARAAKGAWVC